MHNKRIYTWDDLVAESHQLATRIKLSEWKPSAIVGIARGGLVVAATLSYQLDVKKVYTVCVQSYEGQDRGPVKFLTEPPTEPVSDVLIVDDLVDSGNTMLALSTHPSFPNNRTAVLHWKSTSIFNPTYVCKQYPADQWIVYPWENE